MKDKEFRYAMQRVKAVVAKWIDCCGLGRWRSVEIYYHRDTESLVDGVGDPHINDDDRKTAGRTVVHWKYKEGQVHFNIDLLGRLSDNDLDYIVRHEFCHLLVNEMREWQHGLKTGMPHEERVVTELATVLGWVRDAGRADARAPKKPKKRSRGAK